MVGVAPEEEEAGIAQADRFVPGARRGHLLRVKRERLAYRREILHRIGVAAREQYAVVGEQGRGLTNSRCCHCQQRRREGLSGRIEDFGGAGVVTAGDQDLAAV